MANIKYDYLFKLLILGESGVGKTCLLLRYADDSFITTHLTTIGIDFKVKIINLENKIIKLQIWDTAGQERFRNISRTYYKGAQGIILTYDITDQSSFRNVRNWIKQVEENAPTNVCKVLVGNKCDKSDRVVTEEEGKMLANDFGMRFFETSAKTNQNVNEVFQFLIKEILKPYQENTKTKVVQELNQYKNNKITNNNEINNENKELKIKINNLKKEIDDLNFKLKNLEKEKDNIKREKIELIKQNNDLLLQLKNLNKETKNNLKNIDNKIDANKIIELYEKLEMKEKEIKELKNKIEFNPINLDNLMTVIFYSTDQQIHYSLICKKTDVFINLEKKLYEVYPKYKECENYFLVSSKKVNRFKTLEENEIKNSEIITLVQYDLE